MADVIGAVRVVLGADTAAFEEGLKGAAKSFDKFGKDMKLAGAAVATAFTAAVIALGVAVKRTIDEADKIGKMAQSFGVPVEELSRLKHAADLSDVSIESLGKSLGILSRNMSMAASQGTGPAADAFRTLGIAVTNAGGGLKSTNEIMEEVADRFGKMQDGAGKTALAMAIFGRSGADLIPMLNQGGDALRQMGAEADKLGIVITERTAKAAEDFNDNLTRLGKVQDGIVLKITEGLLPGLQAVAQHFIDVARESDIATKVGDTLANWLVNVGALAIQVGAGIERFSANLVVLADVIRRVASGDFTGALESWRAGAEATSAAFLKAGESAAKMRESFSTVPIGQSMFGDAGDQADKAAAPIIQNLQKINAERQKGIVLQRQMDTEAESIMENVRAPWEKLQEKVEEVNQAFARGILTQEQFAKASAVVAQRVANNYASAAASALDTFGEVFAQFGAKNKALFAASKAFSIASAIISAYVGANKALAEYPPPLSFAMAAAVIAAGLANVAKISAQEPPKFATGGSFKVGGVGGIDSQRIMMDLSPGEMVDVKKGDSGSRATELVIPAIRPRDFFTGETVREMVMAIDRWSRDGGTGIRFAT